MHSDGSPEFRWARFVKPGYEVSTRGDDRFSAFNAIMEDGRTLEQHYQCDVKGYQPGGVNWRLGKGRPPVDPETDLWEEYLALWRRWAERNPGLMKDLHRTLVRKRRCVLTDMFAKTHVNQAHALAVLLNEMSDKESDHD